jgi:hypothetical protein
VISKLAKAPEPDFHQPLPWENGRLVAVQGRRVTVLAPPEQARNLARVLPVAEQAAVVDDKFAALNHTPQDRYRIYLAGEKQWKSWYGGTGDEWAIGVSVPLNMYGTDFVRLVLTEDNSYDQAARDAYGTSFATVDRGCVAWIRSQV